MPNDDPQSTDGAQQQGAEVQQQQNTAQDAQNQAQERSGGQGGTPTPRDVRQAASEAANGDQEHGRSLGDLDPAVQRELDRARNDAARYRREKDTAVQQVQQEADARVQAILEAAGIKTEKDDDPEQAAAQDRQAREQAEADARAARVELAVFRAAPGKNADATALLDSRSFLERVKDLDPTDTDALSAAIGDAVQDNPRLAATQAAARSSADFTGGSGDGAITQEKFNGMGMAERNALYRADPDTYRRLAATK